MTDAEVVRERGLVHAYLRLSGCDKAMAAWLVCDDSDLMVLGRVMRDGLGQLVGDVETEPSIEVQR